MEIIVAVISSGLLSTLITQLFSAINKRKEEKSGSTAALRLVMKDRLRFLCGKYIEQGWIYSDELDDIIAMWQCYHNTLKGNGYLDTMMSKVKQLEIRGIGH